MILGSVLFSTSLTHKLRYGQHKQRLEAKLSVLDLLDVLIFDWKLGAFILERSMSWNFPVTYAFCQCFNLCIICQHEVNETEGFHFLHFPLNLSYECVLTYSYKYVYVYKSPMKCWIMEFFGSSFDMTIWTFLSLSLYFNMYYFIGWDEDWKGEQDN